MAVRADVANGPEAQRLEAQRLEALMTQVLVVDDSVVIRDTVRAMLEQSGYQVIEALDGVEGLAALRVSKQPMIVLLDYEMPRMNGEQVLRVVVEERGALLAHEFIIITANQPTFPPTFIELLRHMSIRVLPKPFHKDDLVSLVNDAVARLAAPREQIPVLPDA
jgi:CheY-like chemotaxis protein